MRYTINQINKGEDELILYYKENFEVLHDRDTT